MMEITPRVALEVAHHEAIVRQAYKDSVGKWTWSVGLTNATGHNVKQYIDNPQPMSKCLDIFVWALEQYAQDVRGVFEGFDLSESEFAAALSFHWNTGSIRKASWVDYWKSGHKSEARRRFMLWNKPPEIVGRRKAECDLLFNGVWDNRGTVPEYTRVHSNGTPDWSSRVERNIENELAELFSPKAETHDDPVEHPQGLLSAIASLLFSIFGGKK